MFTITQLILYHEEKSGEDESEEKRYIVRK
jgi:hypothetical protein